MAVPKKVLKRQTLRNIEYYGLQEIFDELYQKSLENRKFRNLMELILMEENIKLAYRNMKKNDGSTTPGVDGKTIEHLAKMTEKEVIELVRNKLEWYTPKAIRRVEIDKGNGKKRPLGIASIEDRLIQQCILQVLEPICEAKFHDRSNGFRPIEVWKMHLHRQRNLYRATNCISWWILTLKDFSIMSATENY